MGKRRFVLGLPCLLLAACATGSSDTPKRPPVNVADTVSSIDKALLVGTWQCHELNPLAGVPETKTSIELKADGSLVSNGRSAPSQQEGSPLGSGEMIISSTGTWQVEGEDLIITGVHTEAKPADGNAIMGAITSFATSIVNSSSEAMTPHQSNVLRLSRHELVMRPVDVEDPPVISCTR